MGQASFIDGDIRVPEQPGLGVELDEGVVERYRVQ
jgi:L-alanine-DL-glutamate epimerase-like enolase superfamily enzyme